MSLFSKARLGVICLLSLLLSACGSVAIQDQPVLAGRRQIISPGEALGQNFIPRYDGLAGISLYLENAGLEVQELALELSYPAENDNPVRTASGQITPGAVGYQSFTWDPLFDSAGQRYKIQVENRRSGTLAIGVGPGDTYLDGSLLLDGDPSDAQLAFKTTYDLTALTAGLLKEATVWLLLTIGAVSVFLLPGWALGTRFLPGGTPFGMPGDLSLYAGLSLSLYPLVFLLTDLVGVHLGLWYAWGPALLALVYLGWRIYTYTLDSVQNRLQAWWSGKHRWPDLALLFLVGLISVSRFFAIRGLQVPLWGDSYQHTLITQLFIEQGGILDSWDPYASLNTFTYHFGFHSMAAVFAWLTGLPAPAAVLWTGQFLNILAVVTLYLLAARMSGSRWAGVIAVLIAGLLVPMPMSYVNWGRYTQLAGQAILPAALYLAWESLTERRVSWRAYLPVWLVWGGLALTHYRVLIFGVLFFPAYLLVFAWQGGWRRILTRTVWIGAGGGLLFLPWFIRVFGGRVMQVLGAQLATGPQRSTIWQQYNALDLATLTVYLPMGIWTLLLISVGWGAAHRKRPLLLVSLWWGLIALAANPHWINLPGAGALGNFTVLIAAYIPAALLIAAGISDLLKSLPISARNAPSPSRDQGKIGQRAIRVRGLLLVLVILLLGAWGTVRRQNDLTLELTTLVTEPDLHAAAWIKANTPADSRFLVNQFLAFGGTVLVGSDAGWWLPLLAGRATTLPPINYSLESGPRPDYIVWVNELYRQIEDQGILSESVQASLRDRGVTHIYIGQRQGKVNYNGPMVLDPEVLLSDPAFDPLYHQDRVWIFKFSSE